MDERFPNELLSTYLDGEASAEEIGRIEAWLAHSREARDELADARRVAHLLRSLPQESPGDEFVSAVMRQVEREVLIPSAPVARMSRSRRRGWIVVVSGLAVSAAAVLLLLPALFGPESGQELARNEVEFNVDSPSGASADRSGAATPMIAAREADSVSEMGEREALSFSDAPPAAAHHSGRSPATAPAEAVPQPTGGAEVRVAGQRRGEDLSRIRRSMARLNLNTVEIGDVVPYFQTSGDRAAVLKLTVVDIRRAAGNLQVLLAKNSVLPVSDAEAADNRATTAEQAEVQLQAVEEFREIDGMLALYVESSDAQLISVLEELEADEQFVDFELEPPVALDGIELAAVRGLQERDNAAAGPHRAYGVETLGEVVSRSRALRYQSIDQSAATLQERMADSAKSGRLKAQPEAGHGPTNLARSKADAAPSAAVPAESQEPLVAQNAFQVQTLVNVPRESNRFGNTFEFKQPAPPPAAAPEPADDKAATRFFSKQQKQQTAQSEPEAVRVIFLFQKTEEHTQDG